MRILQAPNLNVIYAHLNSSAWQEHLGLKSPVNALNQNININQNLNQNSAGGSGGGNSGQNNAGG